MAIELADLTAITSLDDDDIFVVVDTSADTTKKITKANLAIDLGSGGGTGDLVGPASATDNAVARFDSTTGKLLQNSSFVIDDSGIVTTGQWDGTDIPVTAGGTGASTAAGARTNLGIGSLSLQDSSNVTITGGSIVGITDLAVTDGGTGASSAASARTNLGAVSLSGDTMTGLLQFSGTDHAGLKLNSLTTTQRDALTPSNGMVIYNTTTATIQKYEAGVWGNFSGTAP